MSEEKKVAIIIIIYGLGCYFWGVLLGALTF